MKPLIITIFWIVCIAAIHVDMIQANAAPTGNARSRTFGDIVGLNVKYSQGEPQSDLPLLKELGVRWVRDGVGWSEVEPAPGQYAKFPQAFQERLKFYKDNGIGIVFLLAYDNKKAYPNTPDKPHNSVNAAAFGGYAVEVAQQLKASGVRFVLEIWNEPHNFVLAKLIGGEWNAKLPSPWVDHYVKMVHEAVRQVKAYDPQIKLLDDDDMWIIHYWFMEKGLPKALDGFAFHPYSGASDGPEMAAVGQDTNWTRPFVVVDADRSFRSAVRRLREQALAKMGKIPSLWATEWGWAIGDKSPFTLLTPEGKATEDTVAAYIPRAFITAAASGVEVVCWFSSYDSVDGPMGLRSNDGKPRKAFGAFKTMTQQLAAFTLVKQTSGADHLTSGVQAFQFRGPGTISGGDKLVIWNIDGESISLVKGINRGNAAVRITDVQGQKVPLQYTKDGRLQLPLSQSPLYVSGWPANAFLEAAPPAITVPVYLFP